eukprot:TRINITY_DN1253_c0_g1_i3.p1 TRINITY_DN1253_c0_g1~~TRINITY_DN1253_c0_g1_i3.p1  ORF type:complete len:205 (-),score=45.89 TRINITY_DN1253_c0_g1_i3:468-1082(-)
MTHEEGELNFSKIISDDQQRNPRYSVGFKLTGSRGSFTSEKSEGSIQIIGEENEGNVTDSNPGNRGSGGFLIKPISNGSVQMIGETESPVEKRRSNLAQSTGGFTLSMNNINKSNFIDNATIQRKGSSPSFFHVPEEELEINDIEGVRKDRVEDGLVFFSKNFQILLKGGTIEKNHRENYCREISRPLSRSYWSIFIDIPFFLN